jgi:hypothetical protein
MMTMITATVILILLVLAGATKIINEWLTRQDKEKLNEKLLLASQNLAKQGPVGFYVFPLRVLKLCLDTLFGSEIYSQKVRQRSGVLTVGILVCSLGIAGLLSAKPFGIEEAPWVAYDEAVNLALKVLKSSNYKEPALIEAQNTEIRFLEAAKEPTWKWLYVLSFLSLTAFITVLGGIYTIRIVRHFLKEMLTTESPVLVAGVIALNLICACSAATIILFFIEVISSPEILISVYISSILIGHTIFIDFLLFLGNIGFIWWVSPAWARALKVGVLAPVLALNLTALAALITYPIRYPLHKFVVDVLHRALSSEKGIIALISVTAFALAGVMAAIQHYWNVVAEYLATNSLDTLDKITKILPHG